MDERNYILPDLVPSEGDDVDGASQNLVDIPEEVPVKKPALCTRILDNTYKIVIWGLITVAAVVVIMGIYFKHVQDELSHWGRSQ